MVRFMDQLWSNLLKHRMYIYELLSECFRQQKADEEKEAEERPSWSGKLLDGMYHRQMKELADMEKNIPVAGEGWSQGQQRGNDNGSTRTGREQDR